jgi:hypothetical protein
MEVFGHLVLPPPNRVAHLVFAVRGAGEGSHLEGLSPADTGG